MKSKEELDHFYLYYIGFIHFVTFIGEVRNYRYHNNFFFHQKNRVNSKYNELLV